MEKNSSLKKRLVHRYNCLCYCHGNVIRTVDHDKSLKSGKPKTSKIVLVAIKEYHCCVGSEILLVMNFN